MKRKLRRLKAQPQVSRPGGVIGGALGVLAGIGVLAIPGAGPFIAAGPIMEDWRGSGLVDPLAVWSEPWSD
jgi:hypothetical protein